MHPNYYDELAPPIPNTSREEMRKLSRVIPKHPAMDPKRPWLPAMGLTRSAGARGGSYPPFPGIKVEVPGFPPEPVPTFEVEWRAGVDVYCRLCRGKYGGQIQPGGQFYYVFRKEVLELLYPLHSVPGYVEFALSELMRLNDRAPFPQQVFGRKAIESFLPVYVRQVSPYYRSFTMSDAERRRYYEQVPHALGVVAPVRSGDSGSASPGQEAGDRAGPHLEVGQAGRPKPPV